MHSHPHFARPFPGAARIIAEYRDAFLVQTPDSEILARPSGKLRHEAITRSDLPAVGDWVLLEDETITGILPRKSLLSRKAAGRALEEQVLGANLDTLFLVSALNEDFNLRRIERYVALAWEGGIQPVVLLNKADLCPDWEARKAEAEQTAPGAPVLVLSAHDGTGLESLSPFLETGKTIALLGSSGVGKSTLTNRLLGETVEATGGLREDGRGRHTTTTRHLHLLPSGCFLMDTPGMRELQLWGGEEGIEMAFPEIDRWAESCRFRDCQHDSEPGCAVRAAIERGEIPLERFENYRKLQRESRHLAEKKDPRLSAKRTAWHKEISRAIRQMKKE